MTQRASPPLPWKTRLYIALLSAVTDGVRRSDGTINRCLLSFFDARSSASAKPRRGVRTADVSVDPSRDLWFRLFVPSSASSGRIPVIVYFHGGGFAYLSPASRAYDAFCRRICREINALVVSVNYRLAPEHRYPAPYEDAVDVLRFLNDGGLASADATAAGLADLSRCFLAGDSAGGNMVHHVARRWAADAPGGWKNLRLAGMVLIQPFFGGEERTSRRCGWRGRRWCRWSGRTGCGGCSCRRGRAGTTRRRTCSGRGLMASWRRRCRRRWWSWGASTHFRTGSGGTTRG
ncbi:unnamed protein product [Musa textilis]